MTMLKNNMAIILLKNGFRGEDNHGLAIKNDDSELEVLFFNNKNGQVFPMGENITLFADDLLKIALSNFDPNGQNFEAFIEKIKYDALKKFPNWKPFQYINKEGRYLVTDDPSNEYDHCLVHVYQNKNGKFLIERDENCEVEEKLYFFDFDSLNNKGS